MESKYVKIKALGKGSFGSAILIRRKSDGELLVVKEVNLTKMSSKEREEARNECKVLQSLRHPNIVRYIEHYEHRGILYIVMEYADGGDLSHKIKESGGRGLKEHTIMYYFAQLCLAIEYLHSRHILHRDIKTMNIFLMKNGSVKLGDFGISTVLRNTMGMANTVCGTPYYFSPELCKNRPYNNRSDVWAMGVVLYEMMTGKHPYDANSMQQLMQRIVRSSYAPVPTAYSRGLRDLLSSSLEKDPMRRPNIKQMLAYPCIRAALEKLETDLMLATQCRVRLQDIMDFPRGSGRSTESQSSGGVSRSPSSQQLIVQNDPRQGRQRSNSPPVSARRPMAVSPQRAPDQLKADMDRVDAFILQLNRPVNDRAKDAIQEYMRKKQDEVAAQRKREEEMKKKQEERKLELKKIMEDHQKQMLEHAKLKLQRVQQQVNNPPPHHLPSAAPVQATPSPVPNKPKRPIPSSLEAVYGHPTPRKNVRHVLAANSPANAKRFMAQPNIQPTAMHTPSQQQLFPPRPRPAVAVDRAQNWVDKQADKKRGEIEDRHVRRLEEERRMVRDLDVYGGDKGGAKPSPGCESLSNPVVDPELAAWVRRTSSIGDAVSARSTSPQTGLEHHELPAGVDARRRVFGSSPASNALEIQRHAVAAGALLREQHNPPPEPNPHTPTSDRPSRQQDFRRVSAQAPTGSAAVSRSSSCSSQQANVFRPSEVPQAIDDSPDLQQRTAPHGMLGGHRQDVIPFVRYAGEIEDEQEEELHIAVPEIIQSLRAPSIVSPRPDSLSESPDVPVEQYSAMLSHLKEVLDKKPPSHMASRHQVAILDADAIKEAKSGGRSKQGISPCRGDGSVVDTEAFMMGDNSDEEGCEDSDAESTEEDDDFEDEEPITPSHAGGGQDDSGDDSGVGDDHDLTGSFRLRHLCGVGFHGQIAVHPSTGAALFPSGSISRHTNEFQLRVALERRLSVTGLDAITLQLEALPVGSPMEARVLEDIRAAAAMHLARVKRCPTSTIAPQEAADSVALCAQLLFFQEE